MQSSRNTTESPTADQLYAALTRKLKKASANIVKRKLATGEYVMHAGRVVPANVIAEAKVEAAEERKSRTPVAYQPLRATPREVKRLDFGAWVGSPKSVTATSVETSLRHRMHVLAAAPIRQFGFQATPKDGQLFSYDAKSGQMLPVLTQEKIGNFSKRPRRSRFQQQSIGSVALKAK